MGSWQRVKSTKVQLVADPTSLPLSAHGQGGLVMKAENRDIEPCEVRVTRILEQDAKVATVADTTLSVNVPRRKDRFSMITKPGKVEQRASEWTPKGAGTTDALLEFSVHGTTGKALLIGSGTASEELEVK